MKLGTALLLAGAIGLTVTGINYYQGIYTFEYGFGSIGLVGEQTVLDLVVNNPTRWTYPVPMLFFNVYDKDANYYGMVSSSDLQWIKPGVNRIRTYEVLNTQGIVASLVSLIVPGAALDLTLDGTLTAANTQIHLTIPVHQTLGT